MLDTTNNQTTALVALDAEVIEEVDGELVEEGPATLPELATMANRAHALVRKAGQSMLDHAVEAGEALNAAKALLAHGEWGSWLTANFDASDRTAQRYMQVASNPTRVAELGDTSIRNVVRWLAPPQIEATVETDTGWHGPDGQPLPREESDRLDAGEQDIRRYDGHLRGEMNGVLQGLLAAYGWIDEHPGPWFDCYDDALANIRHLADQIEQKLDACELKVAA